MKYLMLGAITEAGNHDSLLKSGGRYAQLYAKQMGQVA